MKQGSNRVPTEFPRACGYRLPNPKFMGKVSNSQKEKPTCGKCSKKHYGECLKRTDNCFSCGKSYHKMRHCPNLKIQDKSSVQAQASGSSDAPMKNQFYTLCSTGEQHTSPDMVTDI